MGITSPSQFLFFLGVLLVDDDYSDTCILAVFKPHVKDIGSFEKINHQEI